MTATRTGIILLSFTLVGLVIGAAIGLLLGWFFPEFPLSLFGSVAYPANPVRLGIGLGLANGSGFGFVGGLVAVTIEAFGKNKPNS